MEKKFANPDALNFNGRKPVEYAREGFESVYLDHRKRNEMRTKAVKKIESETPNERKTNIHINYALKNRQTDGYKKQQPAYKTKLDEYKNLKRSQSGPTNVADRPKKDENIFENKIRQKKHEIEKIDDSRDGKVSYDAVSVDNVMRPAVTNLDYIYCTSFKIDPVPVHDVNAPMIKDKDGKDVQAKMYAIKGTFQFSF